MAVSGFSLYLWGGILNVSHIMAKFDEEELRQRAAIAAMQSLLPCGEGNYDELAKNAVACADALIDKLKPKSPNGNLEMSEEERKAQEDEDFKAMSNGI